jgi:hypothetical protein
MHLVLALQKKEFQVTKYIERSTIINYKILWPKCKVSNTI